MIALYSPDLPPVPGGVSDHTLALAHALERAGAALIVLGGQGDASLFTPLTCRVNIGLSALPLAIRESGASHLLLQYVPFLYARRGVAPALPRALERTAAMGVSVSLIVHEPFVPMTRLPWLLTGPLQRLQLSAMLRHASHVFTPVPAFAEMVRRYAPDGLPITVAPSGAVLPVCHATRAEARRALGLQSDRVAVGVFSPAASGFLHEWIRAAASRLRGHPGVTWIRFGFGSDRDLRGYPTGTNTLLVGPGEPQAAGRVMRALDIALAPYADGLTLRRTGALLAIAHGVPTVSSRGHIFDPAAGELADCQPTSAAFADRVAALVDDPAARAKLAERTHRFDEVASLDLAARQMLAATTPGD